jgi:acetyl-CoA C-acetyltransferase
MTDMMLGALHDPFGLGHMGITAENVAKDYNVTRADMDDFALTSQKRAANAIEKGYFRDQITPIKVKKSREDIIFDTDEYVRAETTASGLASLRPAFDREGQVTAGNSSGINDGAAALILGNVEKVKKSGRDPLAKIVSYGFGGVAPQIMGMGPVPASKWHLNGPV